MAGFIMRMALAAPIFTWTPIVHTDDYSCLHNSTFKGRMVNKKNGTGNLNLPSGTLSEDSKDGKEPNKQLTSRDLEFELKDEQPHRLS